MYITAQDLEDVMSESTLIALSNDTSRATTANQMTLDKACEYATETVGGDFALALRLAIKSSADLGA